MESADPLLRTLTVVLLSVTKYSCLDIAFTGEMNRVLKSILEAVVGNRYTVESGS